jgi:hypothetical protein
MVKWNFGVVADAVRVVAGNVDRQSNDIEIARDGKPLYDKFRSLGLFGMDKSLKWAHVYGTSMEPEGVQDESFVAYEAVTVASGYLPSEGDIVLVEIEGELQKTNLHGGYKLRKFVSACSQNSNFFNEVTYDKVGKAHNGQAKMSLIRGKVLFH